MRYYLSSRSFKTLSSGADDPDQAFVTIKELAGISSTIDCTKYTGYVVTIGDNSVTIVNLTPGTIIHIVCLASGSATLTTTGYVNILAADGSLSQAFDSSSPSNSVVMILTVLSDKLVAIGKLNK